REIEFAGVYRIATNGVVQLMVDGLVGPNGLVLSPNESLMFIADSKQRKIFRYTVFADGALSSQGELYADLSEDTATGVTDGMKVDTDGRLWTTGPGGVWVIDSDGSILGRFVIDEQPANLAWGGEDFSTLYITARTSVYSVETNVRGVAPGSS
ncbi:MAG: SMP-30/gluconolactonase/LRE family protein, partial [Chloroflexota bacterium]